MTRPASTLESEVVVVGSGPGGAITACLLAEAGRDVLLVEEGPFLSLDRCAPFSIDEITLKYRNGGLTAALGPVKVQYVEGRCVGGGSEINSGLYHRTPSDILEQWAQDFDVEAASERDLLPHFEACERDLSVSLTPGEPRLASRKLYEGAQRLQWKSLEAPRWYKRDEETGDDQAPGRRQSMTETYIPRALRAGCRLLPDTRVRVLEHRSSPGWTIHAERAHGAPAHVAIRAGTVFLCAGAIQTPALLRRSGITANIGSSLRLHPMIKLIARFPDEVNSLDMGVPSQQVKEFAPRFTFGGSISTPSHLAMGLRDHGLSAEIGDWRRMAVFYAATLSQGLGTIRCLPGCCDPLVRYRITNDDLAQLAEAVQKLALLLFEAGAVSLYPSVTGCGALTSPADLEQLAGAVTRSRTNLMTVHLFSSCPMGENRRRCATDSFGRVWGHQNLHISDASLLCTPPGVNPQGSVMALARRNAISFLERSRAR